MSRRNLVLIVGAGASREASLPTGTELKPVIRDLLDIRFAFPSKHESGDPTVIGALELSSRNAGHNPPSVNHFLPYAWRIRDALPQALSIDNLIDSHRDSEEIALCGKIAIAQAILHAERSSRLYFDNRQRDDTIDFHSLTDTWFNSLTQLITENCRVDDIRDRLRSLSIIVFNYDRCIEHYLYHALQNYYGINSSEAAELVSLVAIYHPYGTVGPLPWQNKINPMPFGGSPSAQQLLDSAMQLRTFTEGSDPDISEIEDIRRDVSNAEVAVFLGFGFHRINLDLIAPAGESSGDSVDRSVYASAYGISKSDCSLICSDLNEIFGVDEASIRIDNGVTCRGLFDEHWRGLTFQNARR